MNKEKFFGIKKLENFLRDIKNKKIFLICGKNSFNKSGANKFFFKNFKNNEIRFFFKNSTFPEINELKKISIELKKFNPDLILAIGGGSVMDYAKIVKSVDTDQINRKLILAGKYRYKKKPYKLVVIPTTAGSGAEVTSNSVIYINKKKYSFEGENLLPDYFFLVPDFIINASKKIKSSAGFDAISQAIESILSKKSTLESLKYAENSLDISLKNYLKFVSNPNSNNTKNMAYAAMLSGKAINISKTIAPHAISYPFTAYFNISHGHAVSLTLNKFLKFNYEKQEYANCNFNLGQRYKKIFRCFNVKNINELDLKINFLKDNSNLISNFDKLGINLKKDYNKIIGGVNILRLKNNPIDLNRKDLKSILIE